MVHHLGGGNEKGADLAADPFCKTQAIQDQRLQKCNLQKRVYYQTFINIIPKLRLARASLLPVLEMIPRSHHLSTRKTARNLSSLRIVDIDIAATPNADR